jgi:hypothetical protein
MEEYTDSYEAWLVVNRVMHSTSCVKTKYHFIERLKR